MPLTFKKMSEEQIEEYMQTHLKTDENYLLEQEEKTFNTMFQNMIKDIFVAFRSVEKEIEVIIDRIQEKEYDKAYNKCDAVTAKVEEICHNLRGIPYQYGRSSELGQLQNHLCVAADIVFEYPYPDTLKIILPDLLPKRIKYDSVSKEFVKTQNYEYVKSSYLQAFNQEFLNGRFRIHDEKVVLFFCHCYKNDFFLRDHDNMDVKIITDIIKSFLLYDDNPKCCSHFYDYKMDSYNHSEIYVIPETMFISFFTAWNSKSKGSEYYDNKL